MTLPAATFSYQLLGGSGGTGLGWAYGVFGDLSVGGHGSYITGTSALSAGAALLLYAGRSGNSGSLDEDTLPETAARPVVAVQLVKLCVLHRTT